MALRPLLAASAAFLAGAYLGCIPSASAWFALAAGLLALWRPVRPAAIGLALGLLRGALQERPARFETQADAVEAEGRVLSSDGLVRLSQGLALFRLRGASHRGD